MDNERAHDAQHLNDNSIKNPMPYNTEISISINRAAFFNSTKNVGERVDFNGLLQLSRSLIHSFGFHRKLTSSMKSQSLCMISFFSGFVFVSINLSSRLFLAPLLPLSIPLSLLLSNLLLSEMHDWTWAKFYSFGHDSKCILITLKAAAFSASFLLPVIWQTRHLLFVLH